MTDSRAISVAGTDLHLGLVRAPSEPGVRAELVVRLRDGVRAGRLPPGSRLPSSRVLARDLGLARNTVAEAYAQLVAEGWLSARQGSGTRVAHRVARPARASSGRERAAVPAPYSLMPGTPDLSMFPRTAWASAARRVLANVASADLGYGDPRGHVRLRTALAEYLARVRGVVADPERTIVCSGYVQCLALLARVLGERGDGQVAVEELGLAPHRDVLRANGLRLVPLPVDDDGARTDLLDARRQVRSVIVTAAHQMPLGVALAPARRAAALDWARTRAGLVIEDDYDGEFRYDRQQVGALQALDPERVIYTGTASKSLAPGLRLAWMVVPDGLVEPVRRAKLLSDRHTGVLDQLTLADLIEHGSYDRHVRRVRLHYRRRRDRLVEQLAARAPQAEVTGIAAGMHAVVQVRGQAADVRARAAALGLAVSSLDEYRMPDGGDEVPPNPIRQALVVGYGTPPEHAFDRALELLCSALLG